MSTNPITESVMRLAEQLASIPDETLDRPWAWQSYDSEGVRFGLFTIYQQLRDLAARLLAQRQRSESQYILGQYHAAYRDLQAALLGLTPEQILQPPSADDWPVHHILAHILGADIGFYVLTKHALDHYRAG